MFHFCLQVKLIRGVGTIAAPNKVEVTGEKGVETVNTKNILIATGSEVTPFPGVTVYIRICIVLKLEAMPQLPVISYLL